MYMQRQLNTSIINSTSVMTLGELFKESVLVPNFKNVNDFWFYHILGDPATRYILTLPELKSNQPEQPPPVEPEPEPEPIVIDKNQADFNIQSSSYYDSDDAFVKIDIKNIGTISSSGFNNVDWRRVFEVTTDINESQTIQNLEAGTPIYVNQNNKTTIYYPKSNGDWNNVPITNLSISPSKYSINGNYVSSTSGSFYIETTPLHEAGDTISLSFNINTTGNHKFTVGKTYIFCADDTPYYATQQGDTEEIVDDLDNPSNNFFVWTVKEPKVPVPEPEPEAEPESEPQPQQQDIFRLIYTDSRIDSVVAESNKILNDILTSSQEDTIEIQVYVDDNMEPGILGQASWSSKQIWLNANNLGNNNVFKLNDKQVDMNVPVLIHEILHVFGLVGIGPASQYANGNNANPPNVYTGYYGIRGYRDLLAANGKSTIDINYVPMEDDFGAGTAMAHFEEGEGGNNSNYYDETRIIDGVTYPVPRNELMTGFLNSGDNYLTNMTVGLLQDRGFGVNYNSQYVVLTGNNFWWIPETSLNESNKNQADSFNRPFKNCRCTK